MLKILCYGSHTLVVNSQGSIPNRVSYNNVLLSLLSVTYVYKLYCTYAARILHFSLIILVTEMNKNKTIVYCLVLVYIITLPFSWASLCQFYLTVFPMDNWG